MLRGGAVKTRAEAARPRATETGSLCVACSAPGSHRISFLFLPARTAVPGLGAPPGTGAAAQAECRGGGERGAQGWFLTGHRAADVVSRDECARSHRCSWRGPRTACRGRGWNEGLSPAPCLSARCSSPGWTVVHPGGPRCPCGRDVASRKGVSAGSSRAAGGLKSSLRRGAPGTVRDVLCLPGVLTRSASEPFRGSPLRVCPSFSVPTTHTGSRRLRCGLARHSAGVSGHLRRSRGKQRSRQQSDEWCGAAPPLWRPGPALLGIQS